MKTNFNAKNFDSLTSYIGNRWEKKGDRLYLTDDFMLTAIGLEYECYKNGNICRATLNGEKVSNTKAGKIASFLRFAKIYVDLETGELMNAGEYTESIAAAVNAALPAVEEKEEGKEDARPDVEMISSLLEEMASPRVTFKKSCLFGKTCKISVFVDGEFVREITAFANGEGMNRQELALAIADAVDDHDRTADLSEKKQLEVLIHRSHAFKNWTEWASMIDDVPGDEVWSPAAVYCDMLEKLDLSAVPVEQARKLPTASAYSLFWAMRYLQKVYRGNREAGRSCFGMADDLVLDYVGDPCVIGILEQLGYDLEVREYGTDDLRELLRRRGWKHLCSGTFYLSSKDQSVSSVFRPGVQLDSTEVWNIFKCIPAEFFTENQAVDYGFAAPDLSFDGAVSVSERPCGDPLYLKVELIGLCGVTFCVVLDEKRAEKAVFMVQNGKKYLPADTLFELIEKYL